MQGLALSEIAGVDEAGCGPWAGPVVAAAVILPCLPRRAQSAKTGWHLGVRIDDSKRLTPRQREAAYQVILRRAHVGVGVLSPSEIDAHNILQATLCAMERAVADLPQAPKLILVDGLRTPPLSIPCWPIVRGDQQHPAIACASIVAKVVRDALMRFYHRLFPHYGFDRHYGYGTAAHGDALRRWGPSLLHRMSFQPVALSRRARSGDFRF